MFFNSKKNEIQSISIEEIIPNPDQPRRHFSESELIELANSIKKIGVMQPIIAKKLRESTYCLIAGERRLRAAKIAGLKRVPVILKEIDNKDMAIWSLVENIQRENLNFIEEASAYKKLMEEYKLTQKEIAEKVGKNQSTISNKIRILQLPQYVQQQLVDNDFTERHARALLKLPENIEIKNVLGVITEKKLNVYDTELLVDSILENVKTQQKKSSIKKYIHYNIYINTLKKAFKTIKEVEKNAEYSQSDNGNYMEILIKIPKNESKNEESSSA